MTTYKSVICENETHEELVGFEDEMVKQLFDRFDNEKIFPLLVVATENVRIPPSQDFAKLVFPYLVKQVQVLCLVSFLDDDSTTLLGQALSQNDRTTRHLISLTIFIGKAYSGLELVKGLSNNPQISNLGLGFTNDFDEMGSDYGDAFYHLWSSLPNMISLTSLDIGLFQLTTYNHYNDHQVNHPSPAEALMIAIANHPTLRYLQFNSPIDYGFHGLKTFARLIGNRNIQIKKIVIKNTILLAKFPGNNASTEDKSAWVQMETERFAEDLAESLKSNFYLRDLQIPGINIIDAHSKTFVCLTSAMDATTTVKDCITFFIRLNKKGRCLLQNTSFSDVPPSLWCNILAKCGNSASLVFGLLHETTPNGNLLLVEINGHHWIPSTRRTRRMLCCCNWYW